MIDHILKILETVIIPMGGIGVFLAAVAEEAIAPIPSAAILFLAGFLFLGEFSVTSAHFWTTFFGTIVIPAALGVTLGSLSIYYIFYYGGKKAVEKWGKYLGVSLAQIEKVEARTKKTSRDEILLVILRAVPIIPVVPVTAVYGTFRMPLKSYLPSTFIGSLIRNSILTFFGWKAGELYYKYANLVTKFESLTFIIIVLLAFLFVLYRVSRMNRKS